jgi:hypothetical protein
MGVRATSSGALVAHAAEQHSDRAPQPGMGVVAGCVRRQTAPRLQLLLHKAVNIVAMGLEHLHPMAAVRDKSQLKCLRKRRVLAQAKFPFFLSHGDGNVANVTGMGFGAAGPASGATPLGKPASVKNLRDFRKPFP